jgi:hypothetical protein
VRERAAREPRDRILTGALRAGSRVDLDAITEEFATSRTRPNLLDFPQRVSTPTKPPHGSRSACWFSCRQIPKTDC